jgi:6-phosphofructo-2-kinase
VIVLVGLPARGKSFVSRKLLHFLNWSGVHCKVFNVGKYRREAYAEQMSTEKEAVTAREQRGACDANFFDASNEKAAELREKVAEYALQDMLRWLDDVDNDNSSDDDETVDRGGITEASRHSSVSLTSNGTAAANTLDFKNHERVAIFDATNSTDKRRQWILEQCTSPELRGDKTTGLVFVESICDDVELLDENYRYKVSSSPDFDGMPVADALHDLRNRVAKYEAQYETITDDSMSYIKIFNLSTKLMVNHIYGRMAKEVVPALMAWHIGTRPVFLCRPGQTMSGVLTDGEDYVNRQKTTDVAASYEDDPCFQVMSSTQKRRGLRGDTLGPNGRRFRQNLFDFLCKESHEFMSKRASVRDMANTGTSISGLAPMQRGHHQYFMSEQYARDHASRDVLPDSASNNNNNSMAKTRFPLRIYTSTMPRAADTVCWDDFKVNQRSNLNPLDKGDFAGMELDETRKANPAWFEKLEQDPYNTRYVELFFSVPRAFWVLLYRVLS